MIGFLAEEALLFKKKNSNVKAQFDTKQQRDQAVEYNLMAQLPEYNGRKWFQIPHLLKLNSIILIISLTSTNYGYDGSMVNALQSMPNWMGAIGIPSGATLGGVTNGVVFGAIMASFFAAVSHLYASNYPVTVYSPSI